MSKMSIFDDELPKVLNTKLLYKNCKKLTKENDFERKSLNKILIPWPHKSVRPDITNLSIKTLPPTFS